MRQISNDPQNRMHSIAPFIHSPQVFSEHEVKFMNHFFAEQGTEKGEIGLDHDNRVDEKVRRSSVRFHTLNERTSWIFDKLNGYIYDVNQRFFNFDLYGYDIIQYTEYDGSEKGFYDFHQDCSLGPYGGDPSSLRKLSIVVALTDQEKDFAGGTFEIVTGNPNDAIKINLKAGDIVAFPSFMIHRVAPVESGKRKSLVAWVIGPKFR